MGKFFGTDGIRGRAGEGRLSDEGLTRMARAIGAHFTPGSTAAIGRDTRESSPHIEALISAELSRFGVNVIHLGILPTPGTALIAQQLDADFAIMITASHNPFHDNGVKLFGPDGRKLSEADQDAIETLIVTDLEVPAQSEEVREHKTATDDFIASLNASVGAIDLSSLSIVCDCANGAAYQVLPRLLESFGANLTLIGVDPDGRNINAECGSTHTENLARLVTEQNADIGIALDGDADRIILIDNQGQEVDGDQIMARLAVDAKRDGTLSGGAVVSTVMSNMGFERFLEGEGLRLERTPVGDRHVASRMMELGANIGGEPSGHILLTDHSTTGDGCLAALQILAGLLRSGQTSEAFLTLFEPFPQIMKNVVYDGVSPLEEQTVQDAISNAAKTLEGQGRVLVRASGTEPKIRVMAEGQDQDLVRKVVDKLCDIIAAQPVRS